MHYNNLIHPHFILSMCIPISVLVFLSIALVERRLEDFLQMTVKVEERGSFHELRMPELYQLVAANNRIFGAVLSKLGIFEGSDAAWDNADYFDTWEGTYNICTYYLLYTFIHITDMI